MKFAILYALLFLGIAKVFSQKKIDSIDLDLTLNPTNKTAEVRQEFYLYNRSNKVLKNFYLHAWVNAYTGKTTQLSAVKLEDRKTDLYWSKRENRGAIEIQHVKGIKSWAFEDKEFLKLELTQPLAPQERVKFSIDYTLKIPNAKFTQYGWNEDNEFLLKYFILQAAPHKYGDWVLQHYKDFESVSAYPSNYSLKLNVPKQYNVYSDLQKEGERWVGSSINPFRLYVTPKKSNQYKATQRVDLGANLKNTNNGTLEQLLPNQLAYLEKKLGYVPQKKVFISSKTAKEQTFFGVDDIDIIIKDLKPFSEKEKNALKLFQPLSYEYIDRLFASDRRKDHWIKNGLQVYLQMRYVQSTFPDLKLSGNVAETVKLFGVKPLNYFHASKLKMNDRYKLLYLYVSRQNFDQAINTPIDEMSNFNQLVISGFKTGMAFYFLSEYLGEEKFDQLIRNFADQFRGELVDQNDFRNFMILNAPKDITWFFDEYIQDRRKVNFALKSSRELEDSLELKVKNQTDFKGPFQITAFRNDSVILKKWFESKGKKTKVRFPKGKYDKLVLNENYLFPELTDRDNYIKQNGLFSNAKKFQFKLYNDIENPEYNQIFIVPQFRWNNYDKFQFGFNFHNRTPLTRAFDYKLSPKYSMGTGNITGGGSLRYSLLPDEGLFRKVSFGGGFFSEHYAEDLRFQKYSFGTSASFNKPPRSERNHGVSLSFSHLDREVPQGQIQTNEDLYNLWDFSYFYNNPRKIHDIYGTAAFQTTQDFQKIYSEIYYRWQALEDYRIGFRFFGGKFLRNNTDTDFFNFGINYITDYNFSYSLLGRSETEGVLSQQFVLAEGGFKSDFDILVDDWIVATNFELPVWKMFDIFVDAGFYKNQNQPTEFIYDAGIRLRVIPDFLELFFPIQSSLGFEPGLGNYHERIRWTLNFSLSRAIQYLRRGWY